MAILAKYTLDIKLFGTEFAPKFSFFLFPKRETQMYATTFFLLLFSSISLKIEPLPRQEQGQGEASVEHKIISEKLEQNHNKEGRHCLDRWWLNGF